MARSFDKSVLLYVWTFVVGLLLIPGAVLDDTWDHLLLPCALILAATNFWSMAQHWWRLRRQSIDHFGIYDQSELKAAIEAELARSRRFGHEFALVIAAPQSPGLQPWRRLTRETEALASTAKLLGGTRFGTDKVFRYGPSGFAVLAAESGPAAVTGMVRRLLRTAKRRKPAEGEAGGPLPLVFGASFYPTRATSSEVLLARAKVALKLAQHSPSRFHLDGAEGAGEVNPQTLRSGRPAAAKISRQQVSA